MLYTYFGGKTKTGVVRILVIFKDKPNHGKGLDESYLLIWLIIRVLYVKNNKEKDYPRFSFIPKAVIAFSKTGLCFLL